jgi:type IV pilus assembly protein PilC
MTTEALPPLSFAYRALTSDGQPIAGTIDAINLAEANRRLKLLRLEGVQVETAPRPPRPRALRGDDFFAFNQQLAQLTSAGLPVEQGLRLIAADLRRSSMKRTLEQIAQDLESGKSLPQAIEAHRAQFPPLYANLVDAGIRAGNLPRILLNLGRHLTLVRRLQAMLWRTFSYPIIVLAAFCAMFLFLLVRVMPQFKAILSNFGAQQPGLTQFVMAASDLAAQHGMVVAGVGLAIVVLAFMLLWMISRERSMLERVLLFLPLIGPILRRNLISRWCDAVGLGVEAGLDLPAAIAMADDAIGSPGLRADGRAIAATISAGQPMTQAQVGAILPPMVVAAIDLAITRNNLPQGLATLSNLYEQQAELRLGAVEVTLTPLVILFIGLLVGLLLAAIFAPMISLISSISSPMPWVHHH